MTPELRFKSRVANMLEMANKYVNKTADELAGEILMVAKECFVSAGFEEIEDPAKEIPEFKELTFYTKACKTVVGIRVGNKIRCGTQSYSLDFITHKMECPSAPTAELHNIKAPVGL